MQIFKPKSTKFPISKNRFYNNIIYYKFFLIKHLFIFNINILAKMYFFILKKAKTKYETFCNNKLKKKYKLHNVKNQV